ncbi:MAG: N-acetylmuramoyl-L-alanine amidase [Flavobacteriaceae bacterium]|jgi:N-acetylmuramoyl-L-alanine amidase|nr:N-acetylmuramoyl-L-alanine amidase [Flavobacteriaceae bacterium]
MKYLSHILSALGVMLLMGCNTQSQQKITVQTKVLHDTVFITDINPKYQIVTEAHIPNYVISKKHFPSVAYNNRIRYLVLHYTVSDYPTSVRILAEKGEVSSHYLVTDQPNDSIDILVSEDKRAYHAGVSSWSNIQNLNDTSVGIEIVNKGYVKTKDTLVVKDTVRVEVADTIYIDGTESISYRDSLIVNTSLKIKDTVIFAPYPSYQIEKVAALAKDIIRRYEIIPVNVVGHSDIAPLRKPDPGPMFPWKYLHDQYDIGAWYDEETKQKYLSKYVKDTSLYNSAMEFQKALKKYGYGVELSGKWDKNTQTIITAFQWHFRPQKTDGVIDAETWAILQALNEKYR